MRRASELKKIEIFSLFSESQLNELLKIMKRKFYRAGDRIYQRGDRAGTIFFVINGAVRMMSQEPGQELEIIFETCTRGDLLGAASLMRSEEYTLTALCLEDTGVMAIEAENLLALFERDPLMGYKLMMEIAQVYFDRYRYAKRQLYDMVKGPALITALPG